MLRGMPTFVGAGEASAIGGFTYVSPGVIIEVVVTTFTGNVVEVNEVLGGFTRLQLAAPKTKRIT